jgi:hypothetical protein
MRLRDKASWLLIALVQLDNSEAEVNAEYIAAQSHIRGNALYMKARRKRDYSCKDGTLQLRTRRQRLALMSNNITLNPATGFGTINACA